MSSPRPDPHVVMVVANDVAADGRVLKSATSAAGAGYRVTVLGWTRSNRREDLILHDRLLVRRLPVGDTFQGVADEEKAAQRELLTHKLGLREANASVGRLRAEQQAALTQGDRRRAQRAALQIRLLRRAARSQQRRHQRGSAGPARLWARWAPERASWRDHVGRLNDLEWSFGPAIDDLAPDLLHAHDFHVIGIVERAAARARARGREVPTLYDAHEFVAGIARPGAAEVPAFADMERDYIGRYDAVITVSEPLADLLQERYGLEERPRVVLNAPHPRSDDDADGPSLREDLGLDAETKLMVYSGGLAAVRGVDTAVTALVDLPDWHLALVAKSDDPQLRVLRMLATQLGVEERLHDVPFVAPSAVPSYISSATLGIHPLRSGFTNHEVALPNKLFEYLLAGLPVVVSDCRAMAAFTREYDVGDVFVSGDAASLAAAVERSHGRLDHLRVRCADPWLRQRFSWPAQEKVLLEEYARLTVPPPRREVERFDVAVPASRRPEPGPSVIIGPRNLHSRGVALVRALLATRADIQAHAIVRGGGRSDAHRTTIHRPDWNSPSWQARHFGDWIEHGFGAVILESGDGLFGPFPGGGVAGEVALYRARDVRVGVLLHDTAEEHLPECRSLLDDLDAVILATSPFETCGRWLPEPIALSAPVVPSPPPDERNPLRILLVGNSALTHAVACLADELRRPVEIEEAAAELESAWRAAGYHFVVDGTAVSGYGPFAVRAMAGGVPIIVDPHGHDPGIAVPGIASGELATSLEELDAASWQELSQDALAHAHAQHDGRVAVEVLLTHLLHS